MSVATTYRASPVERVRKGRRTKAEVEAVHSAAYRIIGDDAPMTVRQVYYRLVSEGIIGKTEGEYGFVCTQLTRMRRAGTLPFSWIADNTRWMRKPTTYGGLSELLNESAALYRRSVWSSQSAYVEVWLEKDALAGVLVSETARYDVPLMVTRGYPSLTFVQSAASAIAEVEKPVFLYYFGDRDPSGVDIPCKVEAGIREFAPGADFTFTRVAVTDEQVRDLDLPTRPTKKSDSRSKGFQGQSVEVDAISPAVLRGLVRGCIESHIDFQALATLKTAEASEREYLELLAERFSLGEQQP